MKHFVVSRRPLGRKAASLFADRAFVMFLPSKVETS